MHGERNRGIVLRVTALFRKISSTLSSPTSHYYGDVVRKLFVLAGALMLVTSPFFRDRLPLSVYWGVWVIIVLDIVAALTSPRLRSVAVAECIIALGCFGVFEYYALRDFSPVDALFWVNQTLALIFFFAIYFAFKTVRAGALEQRENKGVEI